MTLAEYPALASLYAGRVFNRARFLLQVGGFFPTPALGRVCDELGLVSRLVVPPAARDGVAAAVRECLGGVLEYLRGGVFAEAVGSVDSLKRLPLLALMEVSGAAERRALLSYPLGCAAAVRTWLLDRASAITRICFSLGELSDGVAFPADVYRHLGPEGLLSGDEPAGGAAATPTDLYGGSPVGGATPAAVAAPTRRPRSVAASTIFRGPPLRLCYARFDPALVPAPCGWRDGVRQLGDELGAVIPAANRIVDGMTAALGEQDDRAAASAAVRRLEQELRSAEDAGRPPRPMSDRLRPSDSGAKSVFFDGAIVRVEHPAVFRVLQRLIQADGDVVASADLRKVPGCAGRLDQLLKRKLPAPLKGVVHGLPGRGGYFIRLPLA